MNGRKQKSPDPRRTGKKKPARQPGLPLRLLSGAGGLAARHPRPLIGFTGFAVLFSFVAANALWYQPNGHPAPFLATRDPQDPNRIAGFQPKRAAPDDVTTFRIERSPEPDDTPPQVTQAAPAPVPSSAPASVARPATTPAAVPFPSHAANPSQPQSSQPMPPAQPPADAGRQLIADVQRELVRRGLYEGVEDGVMGSRTEAAIVSYQRAAGLPQTGEVSPELLAALKTPAPDPVAQRAATRSQQVAAPIPKPARTTPSATRTAVNAPASSSARNATSSRPMENIGLHGDDPVAAAIRSSDRNPMMTPPADIPTGSARPVRPAANGPAGATPLVRQIQKGLANIAYTDVETDGVAGAQTRAAIRRFEKHYRLPETGEPNEAVLRKLKAIGAL